MLVRKLFEGLFDLLDVVSQDCGISQTLDPTLHPNHTFFIIISLLILLLVDKVIVWGCCDGRMQLLL